MTRVPPPLRHRFLSACLALATAVTAACDALAQPPPISISTKAGRTLRWQAGLDITKWSAVTLTYGNCFTTLRLAGWSGTGPDLDLTLYHNSLATVSGLSIAPASGINLGNGWTHAYGGQIWALSSTRMRVLEDDGTLKDFTWDASTQTWRPPLGFFERLEATPPNRRPSPAWSRPTKRSRAAGREAAAEGPAAARSISTPTTARPAARV